MVCKNCNNYIPETAQICSCCDSKVNNRCSTDIKYPNTDMFGQNIYALQPHSHRKRLRLRHINRLPEYKRELENKKSKGLGFSFWFFLIFCFFIGPILVFASSAFFDDSTFGWILIATCAIGYISYKIMVAVSLKNKPRLNNNTYLHESKESYYFNNYVFGHAILDHMTDGNKNQNTHNHYVFCEVDKRNIRGVTYDDRYAEFVLILHSPIYSDYRCPKNTEFRIADIFDDQALSEALGCDLPARNTPY